jgi:acylphosphatase
MADTIRRRAVATGRVQGVFFRATVEHAARSAGVSGWVCNRGDGAVEAVLEGEPDAVERVLSAMREGPRGAEVVNVDVSEEAPEGVTGFDVR